MKSHHWHLFSANRNTNTHTNTIMEEKGSNAGEQSLHWHPVFPNTNTNTNMK